MIGACPLASGAGPIKPPQSLAPRVQAVTLRAIQKAADMKKSGGRGKNDTNTKQKFLVRRCVLKNPNRRSLRLIGRL